MKRQRWILGILALLPLIFPFGYCDSPFLPPFLVGNNCDGTIFVLLVVVFGMVMLPYWCFLGILSGHWFPHSKKTVLFCNLPILFNAVAEILYYAFFAFCSFTLRVVCAGDNIVRASSGYAWSAWSEKWIFLGQLSLYRCGDGLYLRPFSPGLYWAATSLVGSAVVLLCLSLLAAGRNRL